jgi:hypothetical protein
MARENKTAGQPETAPAEAPARGAPRLAARFPTESIVRSKEFSGYQQDFLRALLPWESCTLEEARAAIKAYFDKGGK